MTVELYLGDCLEVMKSIPDKSIDAVITDPPYGLEFMGKDWDSPWKGKASVEFNTSCDGKLGGFKQLPNHSRVNNLRCDICGKWKFSSNSCTCEIPSFPNARLQAMKLLQEWCEQWATEAYRVLKPGGHLLSFGGTRTYHRMACAIEDAGFEIRDQIQWIYGSGFPKSLDIGKQIDKQAGAEREVVGTSDNWRESKRDYESKSWQVRGKNAGLITAPTTLSAQQWQGWGTALKPANEPIVLARKPLGEPTVAKNVLRWGTGGLNIDGCRVDGQMDGVWGSSNKTCQDGRVFNASPDGTEYRSQQHPQGRFPANVIHDGSDEVVGMFPANAGGDSRTEKSTYDKGIWGNAKPIISNALYNDSGSAARFFYCAKASKSERDAGLGDVQEKEIVTFATCNGTSGKPSSISEGRNTAYKNNHPTVKPIKLMQYLCKLVTPPGGVILDPFLGSGTTGRAAILEGFNFIGIERETEYMAIAEKRIKDAQQQMRLDL